MFLCLATEIISKNENNGDDDDDCHMHLSTEWLEYLHDLEAGFPLKVRDPREQDGSHDVFYDLPQKSNSYHFLNSLQVTQISPSQCGKEPHKGVSTRRQRSLRAVLEAGCHTGEAEEPYRGFCPLPPSFFHFSYSCSLKTPRTPHFRNPQMMTYKYWWKEEVDVKKKPQNRQGEGLQSKDKVWRTGKQEEMTFRERKHRLPHGPRTKTSIKRERLPSADK